VASLMDNLVEVLEEENTQYEKLVELSKSKKRAIIKTDVVELEKITEQEQEVSGLLRNLDNRRDAVLKDMADVLGKDFKEMTITKLIGYLGGQPKEQERLSEIRAKILTTGNQMQECNRRNEELLNQALEMVEFDLTLFKSMRQAPETANYNKDACNTGDLLGSSGFDAKQ
jgi:flagellar biosynthesis/type III secretory pathway chaperone